MTAPDLVRALYRHMEWADALVWRAVLASEAARADATLRDRLHHVHLVQHVYFHMWTGGTFDPAEAASMDLPALAGWARAYHQAVAPHLEALEAGVLDGLAVLPWSERITARIGRKPADMTVGEMLLQVPSHTTHHRGQVAARLHELGTEPPLSDFVAWVWYGKPAADWPA